MAKFSFFIFTLVYFSKKIVNQSSWFQISGDWKKERVSYEMPCTAHILYVVHNNET